MHTQNNDRTDFWALSTSVLRKWLELLGFREIRDVPEIIFAQRLAPNICREPSWSRGTRNTYRLGLASVSLEN